MKKVMKWFCLVCLVAVGSKASAADSEVYVLKSDSLVVVVDAAFPRVISYTNLADGAVFFGQTEVLTNVLLNGTAYTPTVESKGPGRIFNKRSARYELDFPELDDVEMEATLSLKGSVLTFTLSDIEDDEDFRIGAIEIPNHSLLSVTSDQPGAALATTTIQADKAKQMDIFTQITTAVSPAASSAAYAILNTDQLAATLVNNSAYDIDKNDPRPKGDKIDKAIKLGNGRVRVAVEKTTAGATASLSSGEWTYRAKESDVTAEVLWCKVIISGERNDDGQMDWQDGAIAYRDIMDNPFKAELTPTRVAQHISFNFGSQAGEPFLRALDNVKRVNYATDGLGQFVQIGRAHV